ncbi:MAG: hemolysin III family protein [Clostridia bacterium]|nr:hemolysin III family protein [Clostridia bacterium]
MRRNYGEMKAAYKCAKARRHEELLEYSRAERAAAGKPLRDPPKRGLLEEIGNSTTHGVGAVFAIVALVLMCIRADGARAYVGAALYSFGLFTMFTMSCLYHSFRHGSAVKRLFRRFDYSCIYLLIGATFAPILLAYVENFTLGLVFLIIQWAVIATGISLVGVFGPARLRFIHIPLYLVLGWCGVFFIPEMIMRGDLYLLGFILGGGVVYSLGLIPFMLKKKVAHFIWHFFVLAGAVVQWVGVFITIYPG